MKAIVRLIILFELCVVFFACQQSKSLKVAIHPWIGYETLYFAEQFGWLPDDVSLQKNNSATESIISLSNGEVDAAALTLDEVLLARELGIALTVVAIFDISAGADAVMVKPGISSLAQLKGKRIGAEETALGALVLSTVLKHAGLQRDDARVIPTTPDSVLDSWDKGELDAVVCYEPLTSKLQRLGAIRLFDSRQMPDTIFDVLAVRSDRVGQLLISELVAAHFKSLEYLRINREDALHRIATRQQISIEEVRTILHGVTLPNVEGSYQLFADKHFSDVASSLNRLMLSYGLLNNPDSLDKLYTLKHLPGRNSED